MKMKKLVINIKFYGGLEKYINEYSYEKGINIKLDTRKKLINILDELGIPKNRIVLITANNKVINLDYTIKDSDAIKIFPQIGGG